MDQKIINEIYKCYLISYNSILVCNDQLCQRGILFKSFIPKAISQQNMMKYKDKAKSLVGHFYFVIYIHI